ncbi:MAG: hypothetical protein QXL97_02080 [Candidatus Aenigmatarchaeota archaeon]
MRGNTIKRFFEKLYEMKAKREKKHIENLITNLQNITNFGETRIEIDNLSIPLDEEKIRITKYLVEFAKKEVAKLYELDLSSEVFSSIGIKIIEMPYDINSYNNGKFIKEGYYSLEDKKIYLNGTFISRALDKNKRTLYTYLLNITDVIKTISHEFAHAIQEVKYPNFIDEYKKYSKIHGYFDNEYEIEAIQASLIVAGNFIKSIKKYINKNKTEIVDEIYNKIKTNFFCPHLEIVQLKERIKRINSEN